METTDTAIEVTDSTLANLLSKLAEQTAAAVRHQSAEESDAKIPLKDQCMGMLGQNGSVYFKSEDFKSYGLSTREAEVFASLSAKVLTTYVEKYGDVIDAQFDSKRGTSIVNALKSMTALASNGLFDMSPGDAAAVEQGLASWYAHAPLRGIAGKRRKEAQEASASDADTEEVAA